MVSLAIDSVYRCSADSSSINVVVAPSCLSPGMRLVWILARPIEGRIIRSLSQGNFPLCHWIVVISDADFGAERMRNIIQGLVTLNPAYQFQHFRLGIVHQMFRDTVTNRTERTVGILYTHAFMGEFAVASMAYAGRTRYTNREIDNFGLSSELGR